MVHPSQVVAVYSDQCVLAYLDNFVFAGVVLVYPNQVLVYLRLVCCGVPNQFVCGVPDHVVLESSPVGVPIFFVIVVYATSDVDADRALKTWGCENHMVSCC